jgi:hypothetical protein
MQVLESVPPGVIMFVSTSRAPLTIVYLENILGSKPNPGIKLHYEPSEYPVRTAP